MKYPPLLALLMLTACNPTAEESADDGIELLDARHQVVRLSVDLRGRHPTEDELVFAATHPGAYEMYANEWLDDAEFLERIREIYNLRLLTRTGNTYFDLDQVGLEGMNQAVVGDVIGDEPLRLLTHIVANDLPFSEMVTADYTIANHILAQMWDITYPAGQTGWQKGQYKDGRPHSGVLTMTTTWQKYPSMGGNANRHRANAVSKMFLCDDYLSRPIVLNRAAVDQLVNEGPEQAIKNTSCQSCHSTLDPLAANFYGFFTYDADDDISQTVYRPEMESEWVNYADRPPGYFGRPVSNLIELGEELAKDSRFIDCAVETVFEGVTQRQMTDADWTEVAPHRQAFIDSNLNIKQLVYSIVTSRAYRAESVADEEAVERIATVKTASPAQLAGIIEGVTGYKWSFDGREGLGTNDIGLPVLAGGIDSQFVTVPNYVPSIGSLFVQERLAQSAAHHVAANDLDPARKGDAILLLYVTVRDTPDSNPEAFDTQIRYLYLHITGEALSEGATEPQDLMAVWKYLYSVEASPTQAWAGVVSAVLRDPTVLFY